MFRVVRFHVITLNQVRYKVINLQTDITTKSAQCSRVWSKVLVQPAPLVVTHLFTNGASVEIYKGSFIFDPPPQDWPCSSIPQDCTCPCYDDIPADNYNPCLETFQSLV